jgi:hypothetical protein
MPSSQRRETSAKTSPMQTGRSQQRFGQQAPTLHLRAQAGGKRKRGEGGDDLFGRGEVKALTGTAKVRKVVELVESAPEDSKLTGGARAFVNRSRPIVACLRHHFNGNIENFVKKHGEIASSEFGKRNCKGTGSECSV